MTWSGSSAAVPSSRVPRRSGSEPGNGPDAGPPPQSLTLMSVVALFAGSLGFLALSRMDDQRVEPRVRLTSRLRATRMIYQAQQATLKGDLEQAQNSARPGRARPGTGRSAEASPGIILHHQLMDRFEVLEGHEAPARTLEGSPDGRTLASGDDSGSVRLWDLRTGKSFALQPRHHGASATSASAPTAAPWPRPCRTSRGEIYLWNVATRKFVGRAQHVGPTLYGVWFTPDGASIIGLNQAPLNHPRRLLSWECTKLDRDPQILDVPRLREPGLFDHPTPGRRRPSGRQGLDLANSPSRGVARSLAGWPSHAMARCWSWARGMDASRFGSTAAGLTLAMGRLSRTGAAEILYHPSGHHPPVSQSHRFPRVVQQAAWT